MDNTALLLNTHTNTHTHTKKQQLSVSRWVPHSAYIPKFWNYWGLNSTNRFQDEGTYFIASTADADLLIDSNHRQFFGSESRSEAAELAMVEVPFFIYIPIFTRPNCYNLSFYDGYAAGFTLFFTHRVTDQHCHLLSNKPSSVFWKADWCFLAHDIGNRYKSNHKSSLCFFLFVFFFPVMSFNKVPASFCGLYSRYIMYYRECQTWNAI